MRFGQPLQIGKFTPKTTNSVKIDGYEHFSHCPVKDWKEALIITKECGNISWELVRAVLAMAIELSMSNDSTTANKNPIVDSDHYSSSQWLQLPPVGTTVKIVICARGKLRFITGDLPTPAKTDATYNTWMTENSIVLAWLVNSMELSISRRNLWFTTAKEVWDAAQKMYSDLGKSSQMFEIWSKFKDMKQASLSVTQYFTDLQDLWQELDLFFEDTSPCAACSVKLHEWPTYALSPNWCMLCRKERETRDHILIHCIFTSGLWARALAELRLVWVDPTSTKDLFASDLGHLLGRRGRTFWNVVVHVICWLVWLERNRRIFDNIEDSSNE